MSFGWLSAVGIVGIALLILILVLAGLAVRRRWIARHGGTFECSMQRHTASVDRNNRSGTSPDETPSPRWVLGVARYSGEDLQWFRFFSLRWWPTITYRRRDIAIVDHRMPSPAESLSLYADQEIVSLAVGSGTSLHKRDLAMTPDSLTGMLSWLEAAPPGVGQY